MNLLLLRALRKLGILKRINLSQPLLVNNKVFKIPLLNEVGFHNLMMDEFWLLDIIKRLSPNECDVFIDVGANVGQSVIKWKSVSPKSPVYSFEPNPICCNYLNKLSSENHFEKFHIVPKALNNYTGSARLHLHFDEASDRTASTISLEFKAIKTIPIESLSFSDFALNHPSLLGDIKLIKIDIEGSELELLGNMESFLKNHDPILIIEILSLNVDRISRINQLIYKLKYNIYQIEKENYHLKTLKKLNKIPITNSPDKSDYLLVKNDRVVNELKKKLTKKD